MAPMSPRLLRPRASGKGFDPRSLANLKAWLDAADASTLFDSNSGGSQITNGVGVGRWEDKSNSAFHVTQGTSGNRPVWRTNQQNGLPGLEFDGSNDFLYGNHNTFNTVVSVFCVLSFFNNTTRYAALDLGNANLAAGGSSNGRYFTLEQNTFSTAGQKYGFYTNNNTFDSSFSTSAGAKQISLLANAVSGTNVVNNTTYRLNRQGGTLTLRASAGGGNFADYSLVQGLMIGGFNENGSINLAFRGFFYEVVIYDRQLSAAEYQAVENYLAAKWAIA